MKGLVGGLIIFLFFFVWADPISARSSAGPGKAPVQLRSVQADFVQEKHLRILARPLVSRGRFVFQAPGNLRWEYQAPLQSILLMYGGKVRKFTGNNGQLVEEKRFRLDAMQVVLGEISNWLDGRFSDNEAFATEFRDARTIVLTPREEGLRSFITSIELRLADQAGLLDSVTLFEGPGSYTLISFTNRALNKEIPATLFTVP
jgi:outer membrane lipoprotein-sorting protein